MLKSFVQYSDEEVVINLNILPNSTFRNKSVFIFRQRNRVYLKEYNKTEHGNQQRLKYEQTDKAKTTRKKYRQCGKYIEFVQSEHYKEYHMAYKRTENGKEKFRKYYAKRKQELGYNTLNKYFEGSEGHHINKLDVIYIPRDMHRSVWHSQNRPSTMLLINELAITYLLEQEDVMDNTEYPE